MLIYQSPITKIDHQSFDDLSLKLTEIISLLEFLSEYGDMPNKEACTVSALERLANWMQADIEALQTAYNRQHGEHVTSQQTEGEQP